MDVILQIEDQRRSCDGACVRQLIVAPHERASCKNWKTSDAHCLSCTVSLVVSKKPQPFMLPSMSVSCHAGTKEVRASADSC